MSQIKINILVKKSIYDGLRAIDKNSIENHAARYGEIYSLSGEDYYRFFSTIDDANKTILNRFKYYSASETEKIIESGVYTPSDNEEEFDGAGINIKSSVKPVGDSEIFFSHNFCDQTTWWQKAIPVTGASLTRDILDPVNEYKNTLYTKWIDLKNGKVTDEDKISNVSQYYPVIYSNGTPLDEADYTIDYSTGIITTTQSEPLTADFYIPNESDFTVAPTSGKIIIDSIKIHISKNIVFKEISQTPYINDAQQQPVPVLSKQRIFKTLDNVLDVSLGHMHILTGLTAQDRYLIDFDYIKSIPLESDKGMKIVLKTKNDLVMGGDRCVISFYTR